MSAIDSGRYESDDAALQELGDVLGKILSHVSVRLWADDDPPSAKATGEAQAFLGQALALTRAFDRGPQDSMYGEALKLYSSEGDCWEIGAAKWLSELESRGAVLAIERIAS